MLPSCLPTSYGAVPNAFNEVQRDRVDVPASRKTDLSAEVTEKGMGNSSTTTMPCKKDEYSAFMSSYHLYTLCMLRINSVYHCHMP